MAFVPDDRIATFAAGVLTIAAGAAIVAIAPKAPLHRATGLFFGLRGTYLTLICFSRPLDDLQGRLSVYALLAIPFAATWMAYRLAHDFGRRRPVRRRRRTTWILVSTLLLVEGLYALDHASFFGPGGPLRKFFEIQFLTYAAITWAIARELRQTAPGPSRRALFTFMLGFAGEPAYWATNLLAQGILQDVHLPVWTWLSAAAVLALLLAGLFWTARLHRGARELGPAATLLAVAAATAILSSFAQVRALAPPHLLDLRTLNAVWTMWTVAATAYASLRYRLFEMDLQVKGVLRYGSTTFFLALVFWAASEILENRLGANTLGQSLAAAAAVGIALYPLHRLTRRLVEHLMPGVARTEEYRRRRREDIYLAAVERARTDGFVDPDEREALRRLGHGLGLTRRDMTRLEGLVSASPT